MKYKKLLVLLTILALMFTLLPAAAQAATLKQGSESKGVEALQQALKSKGYFSASSTGYYGTATASAVKSYQKSVGLSADGIAGTNTLTALGLMSNDKSIKSGTVKISGTLNLRYGPSTANTVLCELNNGEQISVLSESGGWYKIRTSFDIEGYVYKSYISISSSSSPDTSVSSLKQGKVKVNTKLTVRSGPGTNYSAKGYLVNNASVTISGSENGWYKITASSGLSGYCSADYITVTDNTSDNTQNISKQGKVKVSTRLTVRSGPGTGYSAKGYLTNNTTVTITASENGWYKINTASGITGYCSADYITVTGDSPSAPEDNENITKPSGTLKYGMTSNDVVKLQQRLKELGYFTSNCTGYFGSITLSAVKSFQKANSLSVDGIAGPLTLNALFNSSAEAKPEDQIPSAPSDEAEKTIKELIAYAKTFLGVPYVYGANGPNSFDCTGYTCYVFKHFGYTLPRTAYNQGYSNYAPKIEKVSDLKPGDLVFFNTINDNDLSDHAGIYLGNNQFIHCNSGSSMKVVIQDITNSYYKPRFSWGRRVIS